MAGSVIVRALPAGAALLGALAFFLVPLARRRFAGHKLTAIEICFLIATICISVAVSIELGLAVADDNANHSWFALLGIVSPAVIVVLGAGSAVHAFRVRDATARSVGK